MGHGNKQGKLELCTCLQGSDFLDIMEMWCNGCDDWTVEDWWGRTGALGRTGREMRKGQHPQCQWPAEVQTLGWGWMRSSWIRMEGEAGKVMLKLGSAAGCPARKTEWLGAEPPHSHDLVFTGDFKHPGVCLRDKTAGCRQSRACQHKEGT